jgi:hypothetical protein
VPAIGLACAFPLAKTLPLTARGRPGPVETFKVGHPSSPGSTHLVFASTSNTAKEPWRRVEFCLSCLILRKQGNRISSLLA